MENNIGEEVLTATLNELRKTKKRLIEIRSRKIIFLFTSIMFFCLIFLSIMPYFREKNKNSDYWKTTMDVVDVLYSDLEKEEIDSIDSYNQKNKSKYYNFKKLNRTQTYLSMTSKRQFIMLEEHYKHQDTNISLYITNINTVVTGFRNETSILEYCYLTYDTYVRILIKDDEIVVKMVLEHSYCFVFETNDFKKVSMILSMYLVNN